MLKGNLRTLVCRMAARDVLNNNLVRYSKLEVPLELGLCILNDGKLVLQYAWLWQRHNSIPVGKLPNMSFISIVYS